MSVVAVSIQAGEVSDVGASSRWRSIIDPVTKPVRAQLAITDTANRFALVVGAGESSHRFEIDGRPRPRTAEQWERTVRHIHRIQFSRCDECWSATAHVTGHRLPGCRPVSIGTALALGLRGHQLSVGSGTVADRTISEGGDDGRLPL